MRKVKMHCGVSLDGRLAGPNHELDWLPAPETGEGDAYGIEAFNASCDVALMGYATYEVCAAFPEWYYQGQHTYVFSRTPGKPVNAHAELINEDPVAFLAHLKQQPGRDINLVGGGQLFRLLHEADLIDEICLGIVPVILGAGLPLFPDLHRRQQYRLEKSRAFGNGMVLLWLARAG